MKWHLFVFSLLILAACNQDKSQLTNLQSENDSLKIKVAELELLLEEKQILDNLENVTLANTEIKELSSTYNNQKYQLKISFPKNYFKNKSKKYPVLYVIDAETNFGGVSYIVQRLIKDKLIPEILVVGIAYNTTYKNFYRLRSRDLTPIEDKNLRIGKNEVDPTGGAPKFSDFIEHELFPFIEKNYRVQSDDRAIYGHSYGGLFGSYTLLENSQLFNKYLILGPSLWYYDKVLVKELTDKNVNFNQNTRVYMASGEHDRRIQEYQEEFAQILRQKNPPNLVIKSEVMPNETHRTIFGIGFTNGMRFLYEE